MPKGTCANSNCTVSASDVCFLQHPDVNDCPDYRADTDAQPVVAPSRLELDLQSRATAARTFHTGLDLGTEDALEVTRGQYSYLIGILGSWNAGKTCYLLSLYLMAARGALPNGYRFAGSLTLQGYEDRARHLRKWQGGDLPQQLADHTTLSDPRRPALLHMTFEDPNQPEHLEVLLTDLPGEWSKNLVDRAESAERFSFLRRADGIVIVLDGPLMASATRHAETQRAKHLLERLSTVVLKDTSIPIVLLVSKCDEIGMRRPSSVDEIEQCAVALGFDPHVVLSASFSRTPDTVPNGTGVFEPIVHIISKSDATPITAPSAHLHSVRSFLNFGAL